MGRCTSDYGADVTTRQALSLCIALCLGTVVEWYDFTVYSQLSATLTEVFFPKSDPATAKLSFWGVYAVGFIARPLGALLFGHIGDSLGRRVTLLISILAITLPTTIIGALPTYAQAGIIAPVLLAILRFVQGVAVGGEFGSAIVYLYEMAPKHRRGLLASLAQLAVSPGMILGIAACLAVLYACSPEQLLVWGWRVPFLVTLFTAPLALVLRMHMPEPHEYLHSKQEMVLQRVASTAAAKVAKNFTQQHSRRSSATGRLNSRQVSQHLLSITSIKSNARGCSIDANVGRGGAARGDSHTAKGAGPVIVALNRENIQDAFRHKDPAAVAGVNHRNIRESSSASRLEGLLPSSLSTTWKDVKARELAVKSKSQLHHKPSNGLNDLGCEADFAAECEELSHKIKRHRPVAVLLKKHWKGLALQFLLEGVYGALFYVFFSWVPSYLHSSTGVSTELTLWALMIGLGLFAITVPVTGHFTDQGIPKVTTLPCRSGAALHPS